MSLAAGGPARRAARVTSGAGSVGGVLQQHRLSYSCCHAAGFAPGPARSRRAAAHASGPLPAQQQERWPAVAASHAVGRRYTGCRRHGRSSAGHGQCEASRQEGAACKASRGGGRTTAAGAAFGGASVEAAAMPPGRAASAPAVQVSAAKESSKGSGPWQQMMMHGKKSQISAPPTRMSSTESGPRQQMMDHGKKLQISGPPTRMSSTGSGLWQQMHHGKKSHVHTWRLVLAAASNAQAQVADSEVSYTHQHTLITTSIY